MWCPVVIATTAAQVSDGGRGPHSGMGGDWGGMERNGASGMSYGHPSFCSSLLNVAKYERIMQTPLHGHTHHTLYTRRKTEK